MAYYSHYSPQKRKKMAEAHRTLALMALKMEGVAKSQRMQAPLEAERSNGRFSLVAPEGMQPCVLILPHRKSSSLLTFSNLMG